MVKEEPMMILAVNRAKKGFTLIELLTVLVIMVIIGSVSLPLLAQIRTRQSLKKAAQQLLTCLDTARSFALSERSRYGVNFNITAGEFSIFKREKKGETVDDKQIEKRYKLLSPIKFKYITHSEIVFLGDGSLDVDSEEFVVKIQDKKGNNARKIKVPKVTGIGRIEK